MARSSAAMKIEEFSTTENFAELLEESLQKAQFKEGNVVKGQVISIEKDVAIVDIGLKTEGKIPLREFGAAGVGNELKVGDIVEVYLERIESRYGEAILSREKALREESWVRFEDAHKKNQHVEGVIFGRVKGGFTVDLSGAIAFLPGSQVDVRPVKDISPLMGISQPFQILKMDRKRGNIVVSRRAILEESRQEARNEKLSQIDEGMTLEGTVKNITDYGAFIDLGDLDGLLHVTDISWRRINHPSEVLSIGQRIKVKVIKNNKETQRISLGMKQLEESPWIGANAKFPSGSKIKGNITNIADYGVFVEIAPGIEGLVHVSEMSWTKKNIHPGKTVSVGQEVQVAILDIDEEKHRLSLGMKQCADNPWELFASKHPVGEVIECEIKNVTDFGLFVGFENGIDGLVHASDISWSEKQEDAIKKFKKGDKIKVKVLTIDPEKERIGLGIKQLENDPFEQALGALKKGQTATFTVTAVKEDGIEVQLSDGINCFIKKNELSRDRVEQRPERFAVGDRVDAKITTIDKSGRKISASIKALEVEEQKKVIAEYGSTDSGASLGDILGVALSKSKTKEGAEAKPAKSKKATKSSKAKETEE